MTSAFEVLSKDHEEVKQMLAELERGPAAATGADSDQLALRKKMVQQLVIEESKHEAVEEMYFWPAVRDALTNGDSLADQAEAQEQEAKSVLDRLDKTRAVGRGVRGPARPVHRGGTRAHRVRGDDRLAAPADGPVRRAGRRPGAQA